MSIVVELIGIIVGLDGEVGKRGGVERVLFVVESRGVQDQRSHGAGGESVSVVAGVGSRSPIT
jgi:hypothetical protein